MRAEDLFGPPIGIPGGVPALLDRFTAEPDQPPAWTGTLACFLGPGRPFVVTATAARGITRADGLAELTVICGPPPGRNAAPPAAGWLPADLSRRIGHELRSTLTGIAGLAAIIERRAGGTEPADQLRRIQTIEQNARAGIATVDRVVELSQLEAGRIRCRTVTTDPREILGAAIGMCAAITGGAQCVLSDTPAGSLIRTDPALVKPIVAELITNALIAGAATEVRVGAVAQPHRILIQVIDNGRGVPDEEQKTIFEPFVRGESSADGAVGLGLYLARRRAQWVGGELSVLSRPGYGSTFTLALPTETGWSMMPRAAH
jgi:signal transduction histidine kinase